MMDDYGIVGGGEDVTQVAPRPDAGALVEQITYLTSWPQTTPPVSRPRPLVFNNYYDLIASCTGHG